MSRCSAKTTTSSCKCGRGSPISPRSSIAMRPTVLGNAADPEEEYVRVVLPEKIRLAKEYVASNRFGSTWQFCTAIVAAIVGGHECVLEMTVGCVQQTGASTLACIIAEQCTAALQQAGRSLVMSHGR